jgi:septum formation protein
MAFPSQDALVLASGSPYRKALLDQLRLRHVAHPTDIDESPLSGESPIVLATRLARQKARAAAARFPRSIIIGADQVATLDNVTAFSKPQDHTAAVAQLEAASGRMATFYSATVVLNARTGTERSVVVPTEVHYRTLTRSRIEQYLRLDQPYDCAGSARIEALGIALVERVRSDDPSALLGLPLIALIDLLAAEGIHPL